MAELRSFDGRYLAADQGDRNFVVYDLTRPPDDRVCWARSIYEAERGEPGMPPPDPDPPPVPHPVPQPSPPPPPAPRAGRVTLVDRGPFHPRFYSYWANAWVGPDGATSVFAGRLDGTPALFRVRGERVEEVAHRIPYRGTTEGWYWDAQGWISLCDGPRLRRIQPFTGEAQTVWDISGDFPDHRLWQAHSTDDGTAHSATLQRTTDWARVGTVCRDRDRLRYIPAQGSLDESQISPDGEYLLIKEDDDNRIITLATGEERRLTNAAGALGHSDLGRGFAVGENDQIGACVLLDLRTLQSRPLFSTWHMGHVAVRGRRCLLSTTAVLGLVDLEGGGVTTLLVHGATVTDYDSQVRANLSPCGRRACYLVDRALYLLVLED